MTREEAVSNLKLFREIYEPPKDFADALDMAIEALSAEAPTERTNTPTNTPTSPATDLISRADAIKAIMSHPMNEPRYPRWFADRIKALPSADRPKGEWVHSHGDEWYCSECLDHRHTEGSWEHPLEVGLYFCENCGADMRGEKE